MMKHIQIVLVASLLLMISINQKVYSQEYSFLEGKDYSVTPVNPQNIPNTSKQIISKLIPQSSHNEKLEEVISKLDNIQGDIQKENDIIQTQLNDIEQRLEGLKKERDQVKNKLNTTKKELKTINSVKKKIRRNMIKEGDLKGFSL